MVDSPSIIEFVDRIGLALMHSTWQILAIALVVSICLRCRSQTAQQRYWVACIGLVMMLAAPLGTFFFSSAAENFFSLARSQQVETLDVNTAPEHLRKPYDAPDSPRNSNGSLRESASQAGSLSYGTVVVRTASCMWQVGATLMLGLSALRLRRARSIVNNASGDVPDWITAACQRIAMQLKIARQVNVVHSLDVAVPTLIGWLKPVVLIPTSMLCEISPQHLELIVTHELAHVRRGDFIVNVAQSLIESLLFFHPCVWWLSSRIRQEREFCTDDIVLSHCERRASYVDALLQIESHSDRLCPALAADGGSLIARVNRIAKTEVEDGLKRNAPSAQSGRHWTITIVISSAILLGLMAVQREVVWLSAEVVTSKNAEPQNQKLRSYEQIGYQQIFRAVRNGKTEQVVALIDGNETLLNITNANNSTPLTQAFAYQDQDLARLLIERGANVFAMNHSDKWGMRSIVEYQGMAEPDRKQLVDAAIDAGATEMEIFHAVWRNDYDYASAILKDDPSQAFVFNSDSFGSKGFYNSLSHCGLTPLHYAVIAGNRNIVELLLNAGAEVDAVPQGYGNDSRHTPMYFVPNGRGDIAQTLIDHGANVNHSPLYLSEGSASMVKVVVANGAGGSPLLAALLLGEFEKAEQIIRDDPSVANDRLSGASINTPLHIAAKMGSAQVVKLLLEKGMDVNVLSSSGKTTLEMAPGMYCSFATIRFLVENGADIHVANDAPLRNAIWQHAYGHENYEQVIRYLVKQGSRPRGLCDCARGGNLSATRLLLELGADVNETDEQGRTPLDYCEGPVAKNAHPEIAAILREYGGKRLIY